MLQTLKHGPIAYACSAFDGLKGEAVHVISHLLSTGAIHVSPGMTEAGSHLAMPCSGLPGQAQLHWAACAIATPKATCLQLPFLTTEASQRSLAITMDFRKCIYVFQVQDAEVLPNQV